MNIAYFNATLKMGQDGVTRVMYKMFESALKRNHRAMAFGAALPEREHRSIPMYKVNSVPLPLQKAYRIAIPGYQGFVKALNGFQPDIIHVNSPCTLGFAAIKYARHFNVPIVATYHTHFPTYLRYYKLTPLEELSWKISRRFYNQVDLTIVPAMPVLHELAEHGIERLEYIPNGVDTGMFSPCYRSQGWRERLNATEKPVVLFVSRLVWEKDLRVLAEMYELLRSRRKDFEMVVIGDGHARAELETMMPGAHFLGFQTGNVLQKSYASSDVFVFPSTTETFGLVTIEAMASGVVPVAAKIGGAAGIIEEGYSGLFSKPHDPHSLAQQVAWLLDHPAERKDMSQMAIKRAKMFEWDSILNQTFDTYERIIQNHKQRVPVAA